MSRETVEIFWTGGYDSTFRIVQLSRLDITVQPYYLSDNRIAESYELSAIEKITKLIKKHPDTKCKLLPTVYISVDERPEALPEVKKAYERIFSKNWLGNQYVWLADFAAEHPGVELSIEKGTNPVKLISQNGSFKKNFSETVGDYYTVSADSDKDYFTLFGNFTYPIIDYSKPDMKDFFLKYGYDEIMAATWFCHTPIDGKPCGKCNPCKGVVEEGMAERLDEEALRRYKKAKLVTKLKASPLFKLAKKILHK